MVAAVAWSGLRLSSVRQVERCGLHGGRAGARKDRRDGDAMGVVIAFGEELAA